MVGGNNTRRNSAKIGEFWRCDTQECCAERVLPGLTISHSVILGITDIFEYIFVTHVTSSVKQLKKNYSSKKGGSVPLKKCQH